MLVKDLYLYCIQYEISSLAHCIYHLLDEKKITLEDDSTLIDSSLADIPKVNELIQKNVLGIHRICVYSLKMNQKDFVFIFADNENEAIQFYTKTFHQPPWNCIESLLDFEFYRGNDVISFRDMRRECESFPAIAGYFTRER
jgi:hypothetical protein